MRDDRHEAGGASVAVLSHLEGWEANLVVNLRSWCEGPEGQARVWNDYARTLGASRAREEIRTLENLVNTLADYAYRPLVRHCVHCACVGSDECIFLNLVRTASDGHLTDAALIATLLAGPTQAEVIALLAGQVGAGARLVAPGVSGTQQDGNWTGKRLH